MTARISLSVDPWMTIGE